MKKFPYLFLLMTVLCACGAKQPKTTNSPIRTMGGDDATIYGLVCDGTNDTIVIYLNDPYDGADPDTLDILEASRNRQVFGYLKIGDKIALMRDTTDTTRARLVIVTQDLLGQWCYKAKPTLRRKAHNDGQATATVIQQLPDSIKSLLEEELELGFILKIDSMAMPVGIRAITTIDEDSPVEYPQVKRYRQWYIKNGKLILTEASVDSLGNRTSLHADTALLVKLTPDTLTLKIADEERSYYRKTEMPE